MSSKQQTPLSYLMSLLDVSLADLGDYLYVAQTSISKWKTGARVLKPTSQHFAGIVEYFAMLTRDPERNTRMMQLFEKLYPGERLETPQDVAACIRAFLGGKLIPSTALSQAIGEEARLYTAEVGIYNGDAGCASALAQLGAYIAQTKAAQLSFAIRQAPDSLETLLPSLMGECRLRLLIDSPESTDILLPFSTIFTLSNVEARLLARDMPYPQNSIACLADKALMVQGYAHSGQPRYAALYSDVLTIAQHQRIFDDAWKQAEPVFALYPREKLGAGLYAAARKHTLAEWMDWLTPALPYLTMSNDLLMEVLRANGVAGRIWTHVLEGYKALAGMKLRLYVPADAFRAPQAGLPALSLLCGREIRVTDAQHKRHLMDTAALLRAGSGLSVVPLQGEAAVRYGQVSAFVKRNAFGGYLDYAGSRVLLAQHPSVVESFMQAMDGIHAAVTEDMRTAACVAGILESTALEM